MYSLLSGVLETSKEDQIRWIVILNIIFQCFKAVLAHNITIYNYTKEETETQS